MDVMGNSWEGLEDSICRSLIWEPGFLVSSSAQTPFNYWKTSLSDEEMQAVTCTKDFEEAFVPPAVSTCPVPA